MVVVCHFLLSSCSFQTEYRHSYRILVAKSELLQQEMTHDPECGNTWKITVWGNEKKCCSGAGATLSCWLGQQSKTLCRQRTRRVDTAVSTAFPTRGVHTQSQPHCLGQPFQCICIYSCDFLVSAGDLDSASA